MKNKNLIAISGKIDSGKDTVGKIIQYLTNPFDRDMNTQFDILEDYSSGSKFEIKKFADKLKDIVCILIGCTREQLEDQEFKNTELEERWTKYRIIRKGYPNYYVSSEEEALREFGKYTNCRFVEVKMTPRLLLQLLGTDCGRNIIHPDCWVNATFAEYKPQHLRTVKHQGLFVKHLTTMPNWIITDMRFSNELKIVKDKGGITIRVNRDLPCEICKETKAEREESLCYEMICPYDRTEHESETALDNAKFDYVINNNGTVEDLVIKVKEILIKEQII